MNSTTTQTCDPKIAAQPNFYWDLDEEPHVARRIQVTSSHPEVKKLFGVDSSIKYKIVLAFLLQLSSIHILRESSRLEWIFCCYTLSGVLNCMLGLASHELSHNLATKNGWNNCVWAIFATLPLGIPVAMSFRRYHLEHHRYQGEDIIDVDLPTEMEGFVCHESRIRKAIWVFLQAFIYALRPLLVNPKRMGTWEAVDWMFTIIFDCLIYFTYGTKGVLYCLLGTVFGMGLHPCAGHLISEHIVMHEGQETYSYYGPLNWITLNVGYHVEHHDFPFIPGTRLHNLKRIAPEMYSSIPCYHSWVKVIYDFVMDPQISPFSRTKRATLGKQQLKNLQRKVD